MGDAVLTNLIDAETGQRGYIITGEKSHLEPYNDSRAHVNQNVADLRALTSGNPIQQRALDRLEPEIAMMLATLQERIEIRTQEVRRGPAKLHMDQIRTQIREMKMEENGLLTLRSDVGRSRLTEN